MTKNLDFTISPQWADWERELIGRNLLKVQFKIESKIKVISPKGLDKDGVLLVEIGTLEKNLERVLILMNCVSRYPAEQLEAKRDEIISYASLSML